MCTSKHNFPLLTIKFFQAGNDLDLNQYQRFVTWAPKGNAIAYVDYNNNIHYR